MNLVPARLKQVFRRLTPLEMGVMAAALLVTWVVFIFLPVTYKDWIDVFRPAALHPLNPYFEPGLVFNPPWLFPMLTPVALLPARIGAALLMLLTVGAIALYVRHPKKLLVVTLSAPVVVLFSLGQIDGISLIALLLPPSIGLPFLLVKPQGVFLALLLRLNKWSVGVTVAVLVLSVVIWGFWWEKISGYAPNQTVNVSLFPYSVPVGLGLAYYGFRQRRDSLLFLASLCFSPYFMITSLLPGIAALVKESNNWRWWVAIVVLSWGYFIAMRVVLGQV